MILMAPQQWSIKLRRCVDPLGEAIVPAVALFQSYDSWSSANVQPVPKKEDRSDTNNYYPSLPSYGRLTFQRTFASKDEGEAKSDESGSVILDILS